MVIFLYDLILVFGNNIFGPSYIHNRAVTNPIVKALQCVTVGLFINV